METRSHVVGEGDEDLENTYKYTHHIHLLGHCGRSKTCLNRAFVKLGFHKLVLFTEVHISLSWVA